MVTFLDLAFEHDFRNIRTDQGGLSRFAGKIILKDSLANGAEFLDWFLDHGATLSSQEIWHAGWRSVHENAMARLLQVDTLMAIRNPTLQAAVVNYQVGTTKLLLQAGAPVNTGELMFGGLYSELEEPGPMDSALLEVINPIHLKHPDTAENVEKRVQIARLLLEHGADVDEVGGWGYSARELVYGNFKHAVPTPGERVFGKYQYTVPAAIVNLFKEFGYSPSKDE